MHTIDDIFSEVEKLTQNWDDYGSVPIKPEIIEAAKDFTSTFSPEFFEGLTVVPITKGRLQLEWNYEDKSLELEFANPTTITILLWTTKSTSTTSVKKENWPQIIKLIENFFEM